MLKDILQEHKISIYKLSKDSGVPYSTINDLANNIQPIEKLRSNHLFALSQSLGMSMDELYSACLYSLEITSNRHKEKGHVFTKNKSYYLAFDRKGKRYEEKIISVKQESSNVIPILATWLLDECIDKLIMEEIYEAIPAKA